MQYDHPTQTVGRRFPKAWIIGKTLEQIERTAKGKDPKSCKYVKLR